MNRRRADAVVGLLVAATFVGGGALTWQAYQRQRAFDQMGSMMGMESSMGAVHGTNPLWYALGTVLVAAVVGGLYLAVRDDLVAAETAASGPTEPVEPTESTAQPDDAPETETPPDDAVDPARQSRARVLDILPEDERRVLEPVLSSPGITQIELRDRSAFSKSKVSQTVSDLEKRGLLYRKRQGRTYRVYPSEDLRERAE